MQTSTDVSSETTVKSPRLSLASLLLRYLSPGPRRPTQHSHPFYSTPTPPNNSSLRWTRPTPESGLFSLSGLGLKVTPTERNYDVGDRELLAIKLALEEWRHWLEGAEQPFLIWTEHKNLIYLRTAKRLNSRQARWSLFFTRFNFTLSYRPGSRNVKPDALSCQYSPDTETSSPTTILPPNCVVGTLSWVVEEVIRQDLPGDPDAGTGPPGWRFVPAVARGAVIHWIHTARFSCHHGMSRTIDLLKRNFWWKTLRKDVREYVSVCAVCARNKLSTKHPAGLLHPLSTPHRPWSHISLDFVTGLPHSSGKSVILTIIDRFSKAAHFVPLTKLPSASDTAQALIENVFWLHGIPLDIVSDRGPQFTSQVWRTFCSYLW